MKQLIILLFIPVMASAQIKSHAENRFDTSKLKATWSSYESNYVPRKDTSVKYCYSEYKIVESKPNGDATIFFHSIYRNDTLTIFALPVTCNYNSGHIYTPTIEQHNYFDSLAIKAKYIQVGGKVFELKNNP